MIGELEYDEISFVNVPADPYAQVIFPDLTVAAESNEFAKVLLKELQEDERRTDPMPPQTGQEFASEVDQLIKDSANKGTTQPANSQDSKSDSIIDVLFTSVNKLKDANVTDEKVLKALGVINDTLDKVNKVVAGVNPVDTLEQSDSAQVVELTTKITTLEADNATLTQENESLKGQVNVLDSAAVANGKRLLDLAKMVRHVATERMVDLLIASGKGSPNAREALTQEQASKSLTDLISQAQDLSDKLPMAPPRQPGTAQKDGPTGDGEKTEGIDSSTGDNKPKAMSLKDMEGALATLLTNGTQKQ